MSWTNFEMKKHNTLKVFNILRTHPSLSRKDLTKITRLSWGTVYAVCEDLLQKEIIVEQKSATQTGRPPNQLSLNKSKYLLLAIDINIIGLTLNIISLSGESVYARNVDIIDREKDALLSQLKSCVQTVLEDFPSILSISLSMQGSLSSQRGISLRTNHIKNWTNVNLVEFFTQNFHLPVFLYHDPECLLTYHKITDERLKPYSDGIGIRIDNGIGMALMQYGNVQQLQTDASFEIGHTISVPDGRTCACGKCGCLEAYASLRGMNERYEELSEKKHVDFVTALHRSDDDAMRIYEEGTHYLGVTLANLYALFNPSFILLDGYALSLIPEFFDSVKEKTENFAKRKCNLIKSDFNRNAPAVGAAYLTIDKIIEGILFI